MTTERKHFETWWKKHGFFLAGLNIDVKEIVWRGWEARAENDPKFKFKIED